MIIVHHLNNSRSQRILWLLEELGLPYEIKHYKRDARTMLAPPELKAVHPLGKSPVITDDGICVAESGAIIEYLIGRYGQGRLIPAEGTPARLRYSFWLHFAEGSAMPPLLMKLVFDRIEGPPVPFFVRPISKLISKAVKVGFIEPNIKNNLDYIEAELQKNLYLTGPELSAADIQMSFPLEAVAAAGALGAYPKIQGFVERIHARPAYQMAIQKGGPFELMH